MVEKPCLNEKQAERDSLTCLQCPYGKVISFCSEDQVIIGLVTGFQYFVCLLANLGLNEEQKKIVEGFEIRFLCQVKRGYKFEDFEKIVASDDNEE